MMQMGYAPKDWVGRPVIAILNTWSDINPCHAHFKLRVDDVKRGVLQAGGFPVELPGISLAEQYVKPTTMLYRNMLAMDVEELLRSHPVDGVVLMAVVTRPRRRYFWGPPAPVCRRSTCPQGQCCAATGRAGSWDRDLMPGSTGTSAAPGRSRMRTGSIWKRGLRAAMAPA
jgi:hypothetical protein